MHGKTGFLNSGRRTCITTCPDSNDNWTYNFCKLEHLKNWSFLKFTPVMNVTKCYDVKIRVPLEEKSKKLWTIHLVMHFKNL